MDAYVLSRFDGDLNEVVGMTVEGARVRAAARLDGPEHNAFFALEGDKEQSLMSLSRAMPTSNGDPLPMVSCFDQPCLEWVDGVLSRISWFDGFEFYVFLLIELDEPLGYISVLVEDFGEERVAAISDGSGKVLIEIGAHSLEEVRPHLERIRELPHVRMATLHSATEKLRA